jgi:hypothetical protein
VTILAPIRLRERMPSLPQGCPSVFLAQRVERGERAPVGDFHGNQHGGASRDATDLRSSRTLRSAPQPAQCLPTGVERGLPHSKETACALKPLESVGALRS